MLWNSNDLRGRPVAAVDGLIGLVAGFLFDDVSQVFRWAVVDGSGYLPGRTILLPVEAIKRFDPTLPGLLVRASVQQVLDSPQTDVGRAVSRPDDRCGHEQYWTEAGFFGQRDDVAALISWDGDSSGNFRDLYSAALDLRDRCDPARGDDSDRPDSPERPDAGEAPANGSREAKISVDFTSPDGVWETVEDSHNARVPKWGKPARRPSSIHILSRRDTAFEAKTTVERAYEKYIRGGIHV